MRLYRNLIISITVLAVLLGAYYYVKNREVEPDIIQEESITLFKTESDNVVGINIAKDTGELTFTKIENEDDEGKDEWSIDYPYDIKLVQSRITSLVYDVASILASEVVEEDAEDLARFGLDSPQSTISVKLKEGEDKNFCLGNKTPVGTGYYFMVEGDDNVYTIYSSKGDSFLNNLEHYRDNTLIELNPQEIMSFVIDGIERRRVEAVKSEQQEGAVTGYTLSLWKLVQPYAVEGDADSIYEMVLGNDIQTISINEFVDDNPSDLSIYGLSPAKYTINYIDASDNSTTILLGNEKDNSMYVKLEGQNSVYTVSSDKFTFRDIDPFMLMSNFAYIVSIDNVDRIEVITDKTHSTLKMTREVIEDGDNKTEEENEGDIKEEETVVTYLVNDKEIGESDFKSLYQEVIGLIIDGEISKINGHISGQPAVTVIFYHNDGTPNVTMEYIPVDNRNSAVVKNGESKFYILTKKVNDMLQKVLEFE
jgi:hypothetical protein